jgi:protein-tyrosine phosphatase
MPPSLDIEEELLDCGTTKNMHQQQLPTPISISSEELFSKLANNFLDTLVIDVSAHDTVNPYMCFIGARRIEYFLRVRTALAMEAADRWEANLENEDRTKQSAESCPTTATTVTTTNPLKQQQNGGMSSGGTVQLSAGKVGDWGNDRKEDDKGVGNDFARVEPLQRNKLGSPSSLNFGWENWEDNTKYIFDYDTDEYSTWHEYLPTSRVDKLLQPLGQQRSSPQKKRRLNVTGNTDINFMELSDVLQWDFAMIDDSHFPRRTHCNVIVLDEIGEAHGFAATVACVLEVEGACPSVRYLKGGVQQFSKIYPELTSPRDSLLDDPSSPLQLYTSLDNNDNSNGEKNNDNISKEYSIESIDLFPHLQPSEDPVRDLKERQLHLVSSVWYNKVSPCGDLPIPIIPSFLYLSSCLAATPEHCEPRNIRHIIRLGWGFVDFCDPDIHGITYHDFPIEDNPREEIEVLFDETTKIIETARQHNEGVLVHCHAGVSRSSTIILAYLIKYEKRTLYDAFLMTYKERPIIRPNDGFARALQKLEMDIHGVPEPTLSIFWMSESYGFFIEYLEVKQMLDKLKFKSSGRESNADDSSNSNDTTDDTLSNSIISSNFGEIKDAADDGCGVDFDSGYVDDTKVEMSEDSSLLPAKEDIFMKESEGCIDEATVTPLSK